MGHISLLASLTFMGVSLAQNGPRPQMLSTFIYTHYGDRTPFVLPTDPTLTPLGAQQLYNAGSTFRDRYITPVSGGDEEDTTIRNISPYQLFQDEITVLATNEHYISASAQAFIQGLVGYATSGRGRLPHPTSSQPC
jgi:hypothetical protein